MRLALVAVREGAVPISPSNGMVILTWIERDSTTSGRFVATRSTAGGVTIEPFRTISPSFAIDGFVGDYNQIAAERGVHIAVFATKDGVFHAVRLDSGVLPETPARRKRAVRR